MLFIALLAGTTSFAQNFSEKPIKELFDDMNGLAQASGEHISTRTDSSISVAKNTIYVELLGAGILHSLNYERIIFVRDRIRIRGRIGITPIVMGEPSIGEISRSEVEESRWVFPVGLSVEYINKHRERKMNFEQGIYFSWILRDIAKYDSRTFVNSGLYAAIQLAGFRLQSRGYGNGFYMGLGVGVLINIFELYYNDFFTGTRSPLFPLFKFSIGYSFSSNNRLEK